MAWQVKAHGGYNQLKHPILYCKDMIHRHMHAGKTPTYVKKKNWHTHQSSKMYLNMKKKKNKEEKYPVLPQMCICTH